MVIMYNQTNTQKPAPTFGGIQKNFTYSLRNFRINDQFTITEDLPATKPLRQVVKQSTKGATYSINRIGITSNNYPADLELFESEVSMLAILCPKDTKNFIGSTFAFDGSKWVYVCGEMPTIESLAPTNQSNPVVPKIEEVSEQTTKIKTLCAGLQALAAIGTDVTPTDAIKIASKIDPARPIDLVNAAKTSGYIYEINGILKVS